MDAASFIAFLLRNNVLKFGSFTTKSGRQTPYFFNFGAICTGGAITQLATYYATALKKSDHWPVRYLYGPAYKGIPLAVATAEQLSTPDHTVAFTFDRKEIKDHGEGGSLVGHEYKGGESVIIVEDVLTAGTSMRHSIAKLQALNVNIGGAIVGVDREEAGSKTGQSAADEIRDLIGSPVLSLVNISTIIGTLSEREIARVRLDDTMLAAIAAYREDNAGPPT